MKSIIVYSGKGGVGKTTRKGEVVLFPHEVMPADEKELKQALADGSKIISDGRYIPAKSVLEEVWNCFGPRVGMHENWEETYDQIMDQNIKPPTPRPVESKTTTLTKQKTERRKQYAKSSK